MTKKFIICRGIQGSGKSTYAKKWVEESPETRVRYNNDDLRRMMGPYWIPSREKLVKDIKMYFLERAMDRGYDIICDNMNLNSKEVLLLNNIVDVHNARIRDDTIKKSSPLYKYVVEYVDFKTPLDVCIERDNSRSIDRVGESVIRSTYEKYKDFYE